MPSTKPSHIKLGWRRQLPDFRDQRLALPRIDPATLPVWTDLRPLCPPIYDQGSIGSCTSNAICAAFQFDRMKQGEESFVPSRLFHYFNERKLEGTPLYDSGAVIRDGIQVLRTLGVCHEYLWPYDPSKLTVPPTDECYLEARKFKSITYQYISNDIIEMRQCLASGLPFVFGISVYSNFPWIDGARIPLPRPFIDSNEGGHAMLCVGDDNNSRHFIVRNSWGEQWGVKGYGFIPYEYLMNPGLAADFWVVQTVM